jgi:hypothetical protein
MRKKNSVRRFYCGSTMVLQGASDSAVRTSPLLKLYNFFYYNCKNLTIANRGMEVRGVQLNGVFWTRTDTLSICAVRGSANPAHI